LPAEAGADAQRLVPAMLRVVFFGMDLSILEALRQCDVNLVGVYLPPAPYRFYLDPPFWRYLLPRFLIRRHLHTAAVFAGLSAFLAEHGIEPLRARNVNGARFRRRFVRCRPDLGVVANFGQVLGGRLLSVPKHGFINYHPSLLPKYRGPTPLGHILLHNETVSGVTWHKVTEKLDQGDILAQEEFKVAPEDNVKDLEARAVKIAASLLGPLLSDIFLGKGKTVPQDEALATYFPKLTRQEKQRLAAREGCMR
jgi:folate-dependent phosphoribosylglycinamide formyltransferase PurN